MPLQVDHVADFSHNQGRELSRLSQLYPFPQFVKTADQEHNFAPQRLAVTAYADPLHRQFPCHTAASTWLSALFFQEKKAEFHPKDQSKIQERLDHYVDYFRIGAEVNAVRQAWDGMHKTAESQLPDSAFAWVWTGEDGSKDRRLRLTNAMEVKVAAEWLQNYRDRLPFADRNTIAKKILEKAAAYGASLGDHVEFLEKQAGFGTCDQATVITMLKQRGLLAKNAEMKEMIGKLCEVVEKQASAALHPQRLFELCKTADMIDQTLGIVGKYTETLMRPEDAVFAFTRTKQAASQVQPVTTTTGRVYDREALTKLAVSDLRDLFGQEFLDRVTTGLSLDAEKLAAEVQALPAPDAQLLESLLGDRGIAPLRTKVAADSAARREEMAAWAQAYETIPAGK